MELFLCKVRLIIIKIKATLEDKMRKILIVGSLALSLALTGCGTNSKDKDMDLDDTVSVSIDNKDAGNDSGNHGGEEPGNLDNPLKGGLATDTGHMSVGEVITTGEIMAFDGNNVHIIMGDVVQIFEVDQTNITNFYLNQQVTLVKGEDKDLLKPSIQENFSILHTNMGMLLEKAKGSVKATGDGEITLVTLEETLTFTTYSETYIEQGSEVTIVYADYGNEKGVIYLLNEDSKLSLKVTEINRSKEGEMLLSLIDDNNGEYMVGTSKALLKLNLSEVVVGDTLTFYHNGIMESWPMQLDLVLIEK